jgi:hypothetical protein
MADNRLSADDAPALQQGEHQEQTEKTDTKPPVTKPIVPITEGVKESAPPQGEEPRQQSLLRFLTELLLAIITFSVVWMIGPYSSIAGVWTF